MELMTEKVMAYMILAGILGFLQDRILLVVERILLKWKR